MALGNKKKVPITFRGASVFLGGGSCYACFYKRKVSSASKTVMTATISLVHHIVNWHALLLFSCLRKRFPKLARHKFRIQVYQSGFATVIHACTVFSFVLYPIFLKACAVESQKRITEMVAEYLPHHHAIASFLCNFWQFRYP